MATEDLGIEPKYEHQIRLLGLSLAVESMKQGTSTNDITEATTNALIARAHSFERYISNG